ncbi:MAG: hypothetical protein QXK12_01455 [Candidatus Nezhaarchaeales archaeon]
MCKDHNSRFKIFNSFISPSSINRVNASNGDEYRQTSTTYTSVNACPKSQARRSLSQRKHFRLKPKRLNQDHLNAPSPIREWTRG